MFSPGKSLINSANYDQQNKFNQCSYSVYFPKNKFCCPQVAKNNSLKLKLNKCSVLANLKWRKGKTKVDIITCKKSFLSCVLTTQQHLSVSSLHWTPRCWPSVRGNSTASSTASVSFSNRRSCWWDKTWRGPQPEPWVPSELRGSRRVQSRHLNSSSRSRCRRRRSSSLTSRRDLIRWQEMPLPHPVTSPQCRGGRWTTNCWPEFLWITRR